jgi:hypothetical protein
MPVLDVAGSRVSPSGIFFSPAPSDATSSSVDNIQWPLKIQFGGLLDQRLYFRVPLPVEVHREREIYVASSVEVGQFGYGSNSAEALDDLGKTLSEMYFYLEEAEQSGALGEPLAKQYGVLRTFICPRRAHIQEA